MFLLCSWAPALHFCPQLWLLVLVAPCPEWAQHAVQLDSEPLRPNFLFFPHLPTESNLPPESLHALPSPAEPGGYDDHGPSVLMKMLLNPQESTREPFPDADKFSLPPQGLDDKPTRPERLPLVVLMLDGETAEPAKPADAIKRPAEEEAQDQQLALPSMAKIPAHHQVILQPLDHHYKSPTFGVESTDVELSTTLEPVKEAELLAQQVTQALSSSVSLEQFEPWKIGQEVRAQQPHPFVFGDGFPVNPGTPIQPEELPEHSLSQQESSALSSKPTVGVPLLELLKELSAQPPVPWKESSSSFPLEDSMTFSSSGMGTILPNDHSVLPQTTVTHGDLELIAAAELTVEAEPSATQQEHPAQPEEFPEKVESSPAQQEIIALTPDASKEVDSFISHEEFLKAPSPALQSTSAQPQE
ncbi:PREDICTED: leucine-rich repeat-containing protein 37A3-like, partial [Chinchilla lanigera]|uniref:leucine-rich repeat-containing protein 37A3-like n=1 Tax=Chinchilla lanigera TaxID=34839 RepID=UPI000695C448